VSDREQQDGPQGWKRTTLGEALPIHYGKARNDRYGTVRANTPVYGSSGRIDTFNRALTSGPSLIVGRKGNVGSSYYSPEPCWPIDTVYFAEASEEEDLRFFKYLIDHLQLVKKDRSTAVPGLSRDDYNATEILVPELDQQRLVVAEIEKQFSRLDEAVANLKRVKANLKRYKAAVLKSAVEGKLTESWRKQHPDVEPASKLLERILSERRAKSKDKSKYVESAASDIDNLPTLPKGWIWTSLGQMFDVYVGSTPSRGKQEYWDGAIPWVSSGEVAFCRIRKTKERITEEGLANSSAKLHPQGTVLLGMIGEGKTRGQVAILDIAACNNQNSAAIRVSETGVPSEYVYRYLEGQYEENRLLGSGNNQPALNKARVQRIPFPLPPTKEQQQIVAEVERRLSVIEELEAAVEANLTRADRLRQSVLQLAFSGRLKVTEEAVNFSPLGIAAQPNAPYHSTEEIVMSKRPTTSSRHRRTLLEALEDVDSPVAPEELFSLCGFDSTSIEQVERFYAELNELISANKVEELRPTQDRVTLKVIQ